MSKPRHFYQNLTAICCAGIVYGGVHPATTQAASPTINPISQSRSTHTYADLQQCATFGTDGDQAVAFEAFDSAVSLDLSCADASVISLASQQSQIDLTSMIASSSSSGEVTAAVLGLDIVLADSFFEVTFELSETVNFSLDGMITATLSDASAAAGSSAGISLTIGDSQGPAIFGRSVDARTDPSPQVVSESGLLEPGVYTLLATTGIVLDDDSISSLLADASFNLTFQVSGLEACGPVARFQGLGDLPGGNVSSSPTEVSADGTAVVGSSSSTASGNNPEAFLWTNEGGIIGLGDLGALFQSNAWGVSADGSFAVGRSINSQGFNEAFRWTEATGMVGLGDLPGGIFSSRAFAVSADGSVVLGLGVNSLDRGEAFRWTDVDGMIGLGALPGGIGQSSASVMSPDGFIIFGNSVSAAGPEAFRWTIDSGMVGLGDLPGGSFFSRAGPMTPDGTVMAGKSSSTNGIEAFRWTQATGMVGLGVIPGGEATFLSTALALTPDGSVIVGQSSSANGPDEAYRWTEVDGMVGLGDLPGGIFESFAQFVTPDGSIVIGSGCTELAGPVDPDCCGAAEPFIWDASNGMRKLQDVLVNDLGLDLTGWTLHQVTSMTPDGRVIVGIGTNPNGESEGWIATLGTQPDRCCLAAAPERPSSVVATNRYLSFTEGSAGTTQAVRVTFASLPTPFGALNGTSLWVGEPRDVSENGGAADPVVGFVDFKAATLQCVPFFTDWSALGTVHVFHEGILPGGIYELQAVDARCPSDTEGALSMPLVMDTAAQGDIAGEFDSAAGGWTPPNGVVEVADIVAIIDKFASKSGSPIKVRVDFTPSTPDQIIDITDIVFVLDAFRVRPYPFTPGPPPCGPVGN